MKTIAHTLSLLLLAFAVITPTFAADKAKNKKPAAVAVKVPKGITLNEDQRGKLAALNKEFGPKLAACRKEAAGIVTADQRKALAAAIKEAAEAAANITGEQKTKQTECKKAMGALQKEIRTGLAEILTAEQKAQLKGGKKGDKKGGKKGDKKKTE
jgi:F0F1-type ATP synthase membrane subunit b/b'